MIAYHVHRHGITETPVVGEYIHAIKSNTSNVHFTQDLIDDLLPQGLSFWGTLGLIDSTQVYHERMNIEDLQANCDARNHAIQEYTFELIRQLKYPQMPSRLASLYALESLDDLYNCWGVLHQGDYTIYEIEYEQQAVKLDANHLRSGYIFPSVSEEAKSQTLAHMFSPGLNWMSANAYWSGNFTEKPKPELLISFPVKVLREVHTQQLEHVAK